MCGWVGESGRGGTVATATMCLYFSCRMATSSPENGGFGARKSGAVFSEERENRRQRSVCVVLSARGSEGYHSAINRVADTRRWGGVDQCTVRRDGLKSGVDRT